MFNMTVREAMQRNNTNRVTMRRVDGEYRITLNEWDRATCERAAYFTTDIEDAVLTGGALRRNADKAKTINVRTMPVATAAVALAA